MVSLDTIQTTTTTTTKSPIIEQITSSPRISFSSEFLDDAKDFISICPKSPLREINTTDHHHNHHHHYINHNHNHHRQKARNVADHSHFEFLSSSNSLNGHQSMTTADELFFEGKLLPFWQSQSSERLNKISLKVNDDEKGTDEKPEDNHEIIKEISVVDNSTTSNTNPNSISSTTNNNNNPNRVNSNNNNNTWFVDDDPSPRPPKCTVLWKELLRLKKQRATSTLSPSSSSSSSSSSASSMADIVDREKTSTTRHSNRDHHKNNNNNNNNISGSHQVKGVRKGLERTRSATIRIRPMINVPICSQVKSSVSSSSSLPPLFPLKKGKLFDR